MIENLGKRLLDIIQSEVPNPPFPAAGARMMEEATELALSIDTKPGAILVAVMDALHNEARKANVYPSSLPVYVPDHEKRDAETLVELGDMLNQLQYLAALKDIPWKDVEHQADIKMTHLENLHLEGLITIYPDGKMYRIKRD